MIPVHGMQDEKVGVLGLGRSGLSAAHALKAGGAVPILWDDNADARARAEAEGFETCDLGKPGAMDDLTLLVTSPGIPHLYPAPNPRPMRRVCRSTTISGCSFARSPRGIGTGSRPRPRSSR